VLLKQILESIETQEPFSKDLSKKTGCVANNFVVEEGKLYYLEGNVKRKNRRLLRLCLAENDIIPMLDRLHKTLGGHLGLDRLWISFSAEFWIPNLYERVKKYFLSCETCEQNRMHKKHNTNMLNITASEPMEKIEMDHIEMIIPSQDYRYILTVVDLFSKKVWFLPTKSVTALETYQVLWEQVFAPNRFPKHIISDKGTAFDNELFALLCQLTGTKHDFNLPGDKEKGSTGAVENKNKLCWNILRKLVSEKQDDWREYCYIAAYAYNKAPNPLLADYSPDYVFSGLQPFTLVELESANEFKIKDEQHREYLRRTSEIWKEVKESNATYLEKMKAVRTKELNGRKAPKYQIGDFVLIKNRPEWNESGKVFKLSSKLLGPYRVKDIVAQRNHLVVEISSEKVIEIHMDDAKLSRRKPVSGKLFKPELKEVIPNCEIPEAVQSDEKVLPESMKASYNVKSIVGQRVAIWWPSLQRELKGTIIGYTSNGIANLFFPDERFMEGKSEVPAEVDYYKVYLFKRKGKGRMDRWSLLSLA
jgi:hypothetical protein